MGNQYHEGKFEVSAVSLTMRERKAYAYLDAACEALMRRVPSSTKKEIARNLADNEKDMVHLRILLLIEKDNA
jgi:hypothetical protein